MVSLKLLLASTWLPSFVVKGELDRVSAQTTDALRSLLDDVAPDELGKVSEEIKVPSGSVDERRAAMVSNHNVLLKALIHGVGRDKAVEVGRKTLFRVGVRMGEETRKRLGVGNSINDIVMAAKVLYRVLGIGFIVHGGGGEYRIEVHRCALSAHYSEQTCAVLSAVDEGVVRGLNPLASMRFESKITSGFPTCLASVRIVSGGT